MKDRFTNPINEQAFVRDGGLRDLYVLSTSRDDWTTFLKFVKSTRHTWRFELNGEPAPFPSDATSLFPRNEDAFPLLRVDIGGLELNCHFYLESEIELDLDPRDVADDVGANAIFYFMVALGNSLGKEVILTEENQATAVIFRYDPATTTIDYIPPSHT